MPNPSSLARALLAGAAMLLVPSSAFAADGVTTVDRTIEQTCQLTRNGESAAGPFSLPIRVQFAAPQTLPRGEQLVLSQRTLTLPETRALADAVTAVAPERDLTAVFYTTTYGGRGAALSVTGLAEPVFGPILRAEWSAGTAGPGPIAVEPSAMGSVVPINSTSNDVRVAFTGFKAGVNFWRSGSAYSLDVLCAPSQPVELATIDVTDEQAPPQVEALSDLQSPPSGGATVRIQGRSFTGADAVSFGGVLAEAFTVVSDTVISATVPAHPAADDVQVQVRRGAAVSEDRPADDFDFVGPVTPGVIDVSLALQCTGLNASASDEIGLRLRGMVPTSVQPGATFSVADLRATVTVPASVTSRDRQVARWVSLSLNYVDVLLQGATSSTAAIGNGDLYSTGGWTLPGEPVAFQGGFNAQPPVDMPGTPPRPSTAITAAGLTGGEVVVSFAGARPRISGFIGTGESLSEPLQGCVLKPGTDGVIARVPVRALVDERPVVTKVSGAAWSTIGGIVAVTGVRFTGGTVKIGGRTAPQITKIGSTIYVLAPRLLTGTYDVTVTTPKGTSPVTDKTKITYLRLL